MRSRDLRLLCAGALLAALLAPAYGCGPSAVPPAAAPAAAPEIDVCQGSPPPSHAYETILRNARCEQDVFITMASVGDQLGVACKHCHAPRADDPTKEDYRVATPQKEIAAWMSAHLMTAIKPADGSPMRCRSCHTDENGKAVAKILGSPRDPVKANEWMSLVMAKNFVAADGSKLKCRSCHVSTPGTAEFRPKVILQSAQLPKHEAGVKETAAF